MTRTRTYYLVINSLLEPYILCKDGIGCSAMDENGYQYYYANTPVKEILEDEDILVVGEWDEEEEVYDLHY